MTKCRSWKQAYGDALERGELFGFCVFDGFNYTGTREQLEKIGCINIEDPKETFKKPLEAKL